MNLRAQKKIAKRQLNQNKTIKSMNSNPQHDQTDSMAEQFKYFRIEARYHELQRRQFENLSETNMSQILKRKLFGFSNSAYLVNKTNAKLVIQNHPVKGRSIMPEERFFQREHQRQLKAQIYHVIDQPTNSSEFSSFMNLSGISRSKQKQSNDNEGAQTDTNPLGDKGAQNQPGQTLQHSENRLVREEAM